MAFDFGNNWLKFSRKALTVEKVTQAREDFNKLMTPVEIQGKSFLDIGFGQGLSLLIATEHGAVTVGNDINPTCGEVLARNSSFFDTIGINSIPIQIGSILDDAVIAALRKNSPEGNGYDVVHSWGVLHHTGDMGRAISNALSLLKPKGYLVIALYNKHWSSPIWRIIKKGYCSSPSWVQKVMIAAFYPVIMIAKWVVTRQNPFVQDRGMDFYFNVVDWVGGHPYEYASVDEVDRLLMDVGMQKVCITPCKVPTGCNEFVYRSLASSE